MIELHDIEKHYGEVRALGPVSFEVAAGAVVGVVGLNGVGKSTLLRILACDLRPTAGVARVGGHDVLDDPHAVRALVGYLPEHAPLDLESTVGDFLAFAARIKGVPPAEVRDRVAAVEARTALEAKHDEVIRRLSHGYRQRVGLAQALVHDPALLILDEPTNGLDPVQIGEMRGLIAGLRGTRTILVSSHLLTEISETCDQILVLHEGRIVASGSQASLAQLVSGAEHVRVDVRAGPSGAAPDAPTLEGLLAPLPGVTTVRVEVSGTGEAQLHVEGREDVRARVCRAVIEAGYDVVRLDRATRELEHVFVRLVGEPVT